MVVAGGYAFIVRRINLCDLGKMWVAKIVNQYQFHKNYKHKYQYVTDLYIFRNKNRYVKIYNVKLAFLIMFIILDIGSCVQYYFPNGPYI